MSTVDKELQLFRHLAGNYTGLAEWLQRERTKQVEVLCKNPNHESLLKAQGVVMQIDRMLQLLDIASR